MSLHAKFQGALFPHPSLLPLHLLHLHNQICWADLVAETLSIKRREKKDQIIKGQITERAEAVAAMKRNCKRCNHLTIHFGFLLPLVLSEVDRS